MQPPDGLSTLTGCFCVRLSPSGDIHRHFGTLSLSFLSAPIMPTHGLCHLLSLALSSAACLFPFPAELPASRVQEKATHGFPQAGWVFRERTHGSEGTGSAEGELQRQGSKVHSSRKAPWPRSSGLAKKKNLLLKKTGGKKSLSSLGVRNNLPFDFVRLLQAPAGHGACLCVSAAVGFQTR